MWSRGELARAHEQENDVEFFFFFFFFMYEGIQVWGELTPLGATITQIAPQRVIFAPPVLFLLEITYNAQLLFLVFRNVLTFHHGECNRAVQSASFRKGLHISTVRLAAPRGR